MNLPVCVKQSILEQDTKTKGYGIGCRDASRQGQGKHGGRVETQRRSRESEGLALHHPGTEWSTLKRICALFEDAVGELEFPDIADELFNLLICYAGDGRHIPEPPVVLGHTIADSIANAEVGVVARFVNPVNEGRAGG